MKKDKDNWLEIHEDRVRQLAQDLFEHPETAGDESFAVRQITEFLKQEGFCILNHAGGLSTAFEASWGEGKPTIGFLAEYDALPELGQKPLPYRSPIPGNGHGCGHNLLGAGIVAAACALKAMMQERKLPGKIVVFGCPAEETCSGKIIMARKGCFDGVDVAVSWHPSDQNRVSEDVFQAMTSKKYRFHGKTSHAAAAPEKGRSALDAAELMNVAVNYLREHVASSVRIHYVYTNGGEKPNIVPDFAEVWYYIRAQDYATMRDVERRVDLAARGAAMATETSAEIGEITASPETRLNYTLIQERFRILNQTGGPCFCDSEREFAGVLQKNLELEGPPLDEAVYSPEGVPRYVTGSTDVSAVSQIVPTVTLNTVCQVCGAPGHHWGITACSGSELGIRGMMSAARIMAEFGLKIMECPEIAKEAWNEFQR